MKELGNYDEKRLLGNESVIKDITLEAYNALSAPDLLAQQTIHITTQLGTDAEWGSKSDEDKAG
jgi:hypothetical protein